MPAEHGGVRGKARQPFPRFGARFDMAETPPAHQAGGPRLTPRGAQDLIAIELRLPGGKAAAISEVCVGGGILPGHKIAVNGAHRAQSRAKAIGKP